MKKLPRNAVSAIVEVTRKAPNAELMRMPGFIVTSLITLSSGSDFAGWDCRSSYRSNGWKRGKSGKRRPALNSWESGSCLR
jgi:hypothetical protein